MRSPWLYQRIDPERGQRISDVFICIHYVFQTSLLPQYSRCEGSLCQNMSPQMVRHNHPKDGLFIVKSRWLIRTATELFCGHLNSNMVFPRMKRTFRYLS